MSDADKELVDRLMRNLEENRTPGSALVALMRAVVRWHDASAAMSIPSSEHVRELSSATIALMKLGAP